MNHRFVLYGIGRLLQMLAAAMVMPALIAYAGLWPMPLAEMVGERSFAGFVLAILIALALGTVFSAVPQRPLHGSGIREGFAIVTFGWVVLTAVGSLPLGVYFLSFPEYSGLVGAVRACTDAFFETMSGFTTTGATVITDVEAVPGGLLFWRAMTHWLGGMGIVTLVLAIFPVFGVAGHQMFRGEMPGPVKERIRPRLAQTAKILWGVYGVLTLAEALLLWAAGMGLFDALCHAFATMATGGFSTRNASIGAYDSVLVDVIVMVFMFLAGTNFLLHYSILFHGNVGALVHDREFRFYVLVLVSAIVAATVALAVGGIADAPSAARSFRSEPPELDAFEAQLQREAAKVASPLGALRRAAFQVISITTTTGFCTADFDVWPGTVRLMLVALMFVGGCAGSTAGGIKMVRILVVLKATWREMRREVEPHAVLPLKIGRRVLDEKQVSDIVGFFCIFVVLFVLSAGIMSLFIPDFTTAVTSVAATLCNIGPGLSGVGATQTYAWIPIGGKWVLSLCMLLGRLEIFTVLIAISPISWRR